MNSSVIRHRVNSCIAQLCSDFCDVPNRLLTEDDMRMNLSALLLEHFGTLEQTQDDDLSVPLHSEVRWYGKGRLRYRSDLVIIAVDTLRVQGRGSLRLPSKGYGFNVPEAIIELKFRRPNGVSDRAFLESILNDCYKLRRIKSELPQEKHVHCWVVSFDKKSDISSQLPSSDDIKVVYRASS